MMLDWLTVAGLVATISAVLAIAIVARRETHSRRPAMAHLPPRFRAVADEHASATRPNGGSRSGANAD